MFVDVDVWYVNFSLFCCLTLAAVDAYDMLMLAYSYLYEMLVFRILAKMKFGSLNR